jgi:hypothetical protein
VRPFSLPAAAGALFLVAALCAPVHAALEFHGGIYASYEYTDNYEGTANNNHSESIYEVGPTAQLLYTEGTSRLDLSGRVARSAHKRYTGDDDTEISLETGYTTTTLRNTLNLAYAFTQTTRSTILRDVSGETKIHSGSANVSRTLTQSTTAGLGYAYYQENNQSPDDDLVTNTGTAFVTHELSQLTTLRATGSYSTHRYEVDADTWVARGTAGFERRLTPRLSIGIDGEYQHEGSEGDEPESDISAAFLTGRYALTQSTGVVLSVGYNWLNAEDMDSEQSYALRGEVTTRTQYDVFSLRISREYLAEFTTDRYGTYEARSLYASWSRSLLRELVLSSNITYEERKPVSVNEFSSITEDEDDFSFRIALTWNPLRYVFLTPSYEHFRRERENLDTETENRYRIIAEVRY